MAEERDLVKLRLLKQLPELEASRAFLLAKRGPRAPWAGLGGAWRILEYQLALPILTAKRPSSLERRSGRGLRSRQGPFTTAVNGPTVPCNARKSDAGDSVGRNLGSYDFLGACIEGKRVA